MSETATNELPRPKDSGSPRCPQCGAPVAFDPRSRALRCEFCGTGQPLERSTVRWRDFDKVGRASHLAIGRGVVMQCQYCEARLATLDMVAACVCSFCASPIVRAHEFAVSPPDGLLPFELTRDDAEQIFRAWIKQQWWAPEAFRRVDRVSDLRGVYVPHWSYDARASTRKYSAEELGWKDRDYADVVVPASKGFSADEMDDLAPFQFGEKLTGFPWDYLAGFQAELHALPADDCWEHARKPIVCTEAERRQSLVADALVAVAAKDSASTVMTLAMGEHSDDVETLTSEIQVRSVALPVYVAAYRQRGRVYRVRVNGQTGAITGDVPVSAWKAALLAMLAVVALALPVIVYSDLTKVEPKVSLPRGRNLDGSAKPTRQIECYEKANAEGLSEDACQAAQEVVEFYSRASDKPKAARWRDLEERECKKAAGAK